MKSWSRNKFRMFYSERVIDHLNSQPQTPHRSMPSTRGSQLPPPPPPKNSGKPDYTTIKEVQKILMANASLVNSALGGGQNRHLGIFLPPNQYAHITANPFVYPSDPGRKATAPAWMPNGEEKRIL